MSLPKKLLKAIQNLYQQMVKLSRALTKKLMNWLLRGLVVLGQRSRLARAGFILPTVTMVVLVVVLLTTAIMLRSFDRSKNASNYRVNEAVLNAATPALDRVKAKLDQLFSQAETELQGNTPKEANIAEVLRKPRYILGDEIPLRLVKEFNGQGGIQAEEQLDTAWKFPVDTNNNGKFDSYTLYGIYFRNPTQAGQVRGPLHARSLPMDEGQLEGCPVTLGDEVGWFNTGGLSKKAFFAYVAIVPITDAGGLDPNQYEPYTGNKGFSALEIQRDQARLALDNNAVWFDGDIQLGNVEGFFLNGRVHTNSNLLVTGNSANAVQFRQVSSPFSCFYRPENAQIVVGGNVASGDISNDSDQPADRLRFDYFKGTGVDPTATTPRGTFSLGSTNKTTTEKGGNLVAYNEAAYDQRINVMVQGAINLFGGNASEQVNNQKAEVATDTQVEAIGRFPDEVKKEFKDKYDANSPDPDLLKKVLDAYFRERTRRVPYAEISFAASQAQPSQALFVKPGTAARTALPSDGNFVFGSTNPIRPPLEWMLIEDPSSGNNVTNYTNLPMRIGGSGSEPMDLEATDPDLIGADKVENLPGDRIFAGNSLPYIPYDGGQFVEHATELPVKSGPNDVKWNGSDKNRYRISRVETPEDLGDTSRSGFWEAAAAKTDNFIDEELSGGLRVITGAGIYIDGFAQGGAGTGQRGVDSFLPDPVAVFDADPVLGVSQDGDADVDNDDLLTYLQTTNNVTPKAAFRTTALSKIPNTAGVNANDAIVVWPDTMPMYQWQANNPLMGDANANGIRDAGEGIKGDLQMRATVVYHYRNNRGNDQTPIACISSYYDPTDAWTANNANGISDNGLNYPVPARPAAPDARLLRQARMVFPDGRWANEPLRNALFNADGTDKPAADRTLADNAAIDAAVCALSILDAPGGGGGGVVPDGAITERTFLDGRQIKAIHKFNTVGTLLADLNQANQLRIAEPPALNAGADYGGFPNAATYNWPIEQRQPLEIRVTQLNLNVLRQTLVGGGEYLLPNSGIIYASRDDALRDISDGERATSATDFKLDPTRRPNGIRLINGNNLTLGSSNTYNPDQRGLILASDLPVYIRGNFNLHQAPATGVGTPIEEFQTLLTSANFYTRGSGGGSTFNREPRFACRQNQQGCSGTGDQWRAARILSDAVTLLSDTFQDGFRSDGDYDLNNNVGNMAVDARLRNGFWWNGFATSRQYWNGANNNNTPDVANQTSYLTNGVTPVQRRVNFPEYIMEMCPKLPVSACTANDWFVGYKVNGDNDLSDSVDLDGDGNIDLIERDIKANQLAQAVAASGSPFDKTRLGAGTTAQPAMIETNGANQGTDNTHYARRVAFARDNANKLIPAAGPFQPLGVGCPLNPPLPAVPGCVYGGNVAGTNFGNLANNALWFVTTSDNANPTPVPPGHFSYEAQRPLYYRPPATLQDQPLLVPILNQHVPDDSGQPNASRDTVFGDATARIDQNWLQRATQNTTYNAVFVMGDSPARPERPGNGLLSPPGTGLPLAETGGGLHNFPRFLEAWEESFDTNYRTAKIAGGFIQFKKSIFATAPFEAIDNYRTDMSLFFDTPNVSTPADYMRGFGATNAPFGYRGGSQRRTAPYYRPPTRQWGYDVGLLSQAPDLFSQRFSTPEAGKPNEFYREVNRDDPQVQALLCAVQDADGDGDYDDGPAIPASERPANCN